MATKYEYEEVNWDENVYVGKKPPLKEIKAKPKRVDMYERLTKAVAYKFKQDKTSAGITTSFLPTGLFYGSIVRYKGAFGKEKTIVFKTTDANFDHLIKKMGQFLLSMEKENRTPIHELKDALMYDPEWLNE